MTMGMLGGIIMPRNPADATVARENFSGYPSLSMAGTMIDPMAATVAEAEPEIAPKKAEDKNTTIASPPGSQPTSALAKSVSRFDTPPLSNRPPAIMKKGIAIKLNESSELNIFCTRNTDGVLEKASSATADATSRAMAMGAPITRVRKKVPNNAVIICRTLPLLLPIRTVFPDGERSFYT